MRGCVMGVLRVCVEVTVMRVLKGYVDGLVWLMGRGGDGELEVEGASEPFFFSGGGCPYSAALVQLDDACGDEETQPAATPV